MARLQKKRLDTPVDEAGWNIGLGDLKLGNLLGGLNLHTDAQGNRRLGGNLSAKPFGKHGPSMSIGTDDLGQWSKKKRSSDNQTSKSSKQNRAVRKSSRWDKQKSSRELQGSGRITLDDQ